MKALISAIQIVFDDKKSIILGIAASLFFGAIFIFASGMVRFFPEGLFIDFQPVRMATFLALVVLSGLVIPMQVFALQKAKRNVGASTSSFGGLLAGLATMSCCAPLLLPAILSFLGFSGTQLLYFNSTIKQYVLPLSLISVGLLSVSLLMVSRSIVAACRLDIQRT